MDKAKVTELFYSNKLDDAENLLSGHDDAWALYMLGRIAWKRGNRTEAISLYAKAAALDPAGPASIALEQARQVMDFFNKDLYNP